MVPGLSSTRRTVQAQTLAASLMVYSYIYYSYILSHETAVRLDSKCTVNCQVITREINCEEKMHTAPRAFN